MAWGMPVDYHVAHLSGIPALRGDAHANGVGSDTSRLAPPSALLTILGGGKQRLVVIPALAPSFCSTDLWGGLPTERWRQHDLVMRANGQYLGGGAQVPAETTTRYGCKQEAFPVRAYALAPWFSCCC